MRSTLNGAALKVVSGIAAPSIVSGIKLRRLRFKNLETETLHIPNQNHRPHIGILRCRFLNAGVPDLQNLPARFLYICKRVIIAERKNWSIAPGNQAHLCGRNRITRTDGFC